MAACRRPNASPAFSPNVSPRKTMSKVDALPARSGIEMHPAMLIGLLFAAAAALTWRHLSGFLPATAWLPVLWRPEVTDTQQMLVHYTVFPRIAVALFSGA